METEGRVISTNGRSAIIQIRRKGACGDNCAHCSGCAAQLMEIDADCPIPVSCGDWVRIISDRRSIFLGLIILFILPIALPLIAYFSAVGTGLEIWLVAFAIALSIVLIVLLNKSKRFKSAARPQVSEVILKVRTEDE